MPADSRSSKVRIPEVYVLWHPKCALGAPLAQEILSWLRPGNGFGPDVFYRSLPHPGVKGAVLPPPLPRERRQSPGRTPLQSSRFKGSDDNLQIVLPLVDNQLVADYA